jgi:amino acid transporter
LVIGIKESAVLNNVFTIVNLTVIVIVIIAGLTKVHGHNWNISPAEVDKFVF